MPTLNQAMVFAAGFGKRLKPLTDHTPKPLISIGNTTCLDFTLEQLKKAGIQKIIVNTHYLAGQIHEHLKKYGCNLPSPNPTVSSPNTTLSSSDLIRGSMDCRVAPSLGAPRNDALPSSSRAKCRDPEIIISHEPKILETGGGLLNALPYFTPQEPILIVNGDIWWQDGTVPMLQRLQNAWDPNKMDCLLLLVPKETAIGYYSKGDYFLKDNQHAEYRGQNEFAPYIYPGVCIVNPSRFNLTAFLSPIISSLPSSMSSSGLTLGSKKHMDPRVKPEDDKLKVFSLKLLFDQAESTKRLYGLIHDGLWGDIGSPQGLEDVRKALKTQ